MQGYILIIAFFLLILCVIVRSKQLKKVGIRAIHFGEIDKKDFLIPPFVLLYVYLIIANVFNLPRLGELITENEIVSWIGVILAIGAPVLFIWGIYSFGKSFRVGLDESKPGDLVTTGAFSISRNPLYVAFFMILLGVFLIYPTWIFFIYFLGALWLIDRQVNLEENSLRKIYGEDYNQYCTQVRRYI